MFSMLFLDYILISCACIIYNMYVRLQLGMSKTRGDLTKNVNDPKPISLEDESRALFFESDYLFERSDLTIKTHLFLHGMIVDREPLAWVASPSRGFYID